MKKVKFSELDSNTKLVAISQMFIYMTVNSYPHGVEPANEEEIAADIEQGYNPDEHFSFYLDENEEVKTKIG